LTIMMDKGRIVAPGFSRAVNVLQRCCSTVRPNPQNWQNDPRTDDILKRDSDEIRRWIVAKTIMRHTPI